MFDIFFMDCFPGDCFDGFDNDVLGGFSLGFKGVLDRLEDSGNHIFYYGRGPKYKYKIAAYIANKIISA